MLPSHAVQHGVRRRMTGVHRQGVLNIPAPTIGPLLHHESNLDIPVEFNSGKCRHAGLTT